MKMVQDKCTNASASTCVFGKICMWMSKHPKVAMGLMIEHLRPMSLMQAYCTGKGLCDKPDNETMAEILSGHQPHEALLKNFDQIDWTNVVEEATELVAQKPNVTVPAKEATPKCEAQSKVCPQCMMEATRMGTMRAVMKVKAMCHETKCPVMLKMCPWMKENRAVSLGMILSKVEPWKFAKGWCMHAQRSHEHGWHHHGHHEHSEHDSHHHGDHDHGDHDWQHRHEGNDDHKYAGGRYERSHQDWHHGHEHKAVHQDWHHGHEHDESHHEHSHQDWHHGHEHEEGHHEHNHQDWYHGHEHGEGHHSPASGFKGGIWSQQFWGARDQKAKDQAEFVIQV